MTVLNRLTPAKLRNIQVHRLVRLLNKKIPRNISGDMNDL